MSVRESGEMYLEAILVLQDQKDSVRSVDVGEYLGYSKPSVSRAMGILRGEGYITMERDGAIQLTEEGRHIAEKIYERHRVLTQLLTGLGVDRETASADACKMEHAISDASFEAIKRLTAERNGQ